MSTSDILMVVSIVMNCIVIVAAPIISVWAAQKLQDRARKRQDKMEIFKTLMTSRIYGWTPQGVNALNSIDIVFSDEPEVINQWRNYYKALWVSNPDDKQRQTILDEQETLLETMAKALGYKDSITLKTIQKPYMPEGMFNELQMQNQYKNNQFQAMELLLSKLQNPGVEIQNEHNKNRNRKTDGRRNKTNNTSK